MNELSILSHFIRARRRFGNLRGEELTRYQQGRACRVVEFARRHASYYRERMEGVRTEDWNSLPPIGKAEMMAHFDTFNTRGIRREEAMKVALRAETSRDFQPTLHGLTVGLSSGTSGHRGLFLVSPQEQAGWAGVMLARALPALRREGYRIALFLRSNSNLYERLGSRWLQFRWFDLMLPLEEAIGALNAYRPDILVGPPSLLRFLAEARTQGRLKASPCKLLSAAEVLEPQEQAVIEEAFDLPVHQIYQCTEGLLAVSCPHGSLHIQEDLIALQTERLALTPTPLPILGEGPIQFLNLPLPPNQKAGGSQLLNLPLPPELGEGGRGDEGASGQTERFTPIITDLWRTTQPIIRYRLNDVLTLDPRLCPCGSAFRVIAQIEGRCDDILYFETNDGALRPFFPDTIRRMALLASPYITDYQAFQERPGALRLHIEAPAGRVDETLCAVQRSVQQTLAQYGCRPAHLVLETGLVPVPSGRKQRRVQRL